MIQANYISLANQETTNHVEKLGRTIGGSVVCDAAGQILNQASWTKEDMLLIDIERDNDSIVVKSAGGGSNRRSGRA